MSKLVLDSPASQKNKILVENKEGVRRYVTQKELEHLVDGNGEPTEWPVGGNKPKQPVRKAEGEGGEDDQHNTKAADTVPVMVGKIKASKSEEEARAIVGDDKRVGVLKALENHIATLNA